MAKSICITRVKNLLKKSSIQKIKQDEIMNAIETAMAEKRLSNIDEINVDAIAKDVSEQIKAQKKKDKINAIRDEIIIRKDVEKVLTNFANREKEGLISLLVGSNDIVPGAKDGVAQRQGSAMANLIGGANIALKKAGVYEMFKNMDIKVQRRVTNTIAELHQQKTVIEERAGLKPPITEKDPDIIKVAEVMENYSETVRQMLNERGANIPRIWGWVIKQSNDMFEARGAARRLGLKLDDIVVDPNLKGTDINYNKNFTAWKNFAMQKLDGDRTFVKTDDIDSFMLNSYNSIVGNKTQVTQGIDSVYGGRNITKGAGNKRVLHYKTANDWFDYHEKFGTGTLQEAFFSGLHTAGRNIGMIDKLGSTPTENFKKIHYAVNKRLIEGQRSTESVKSFEPFVKFLYEIDGTARTVDNFALAKYSSIIRNVGAFSKLGGAVVSASADVVLYGSEMSSQGDTFLGSTADAMGSLARLSKTQDKKDIAEGLGFIVDGQIHDTAPARNQIGDNLSKNMSKIQRIYYELNLLTPWTNNLKQNAMLSMANYYAKQKNLKFNKLNKQLQELFTKYNIDSVKWDVIRNKAVVKADDGKEFINIAELDTIPDIDMERILGRSDLSKKELQVEKTNFKYSVSGMLLDRMIHAVIQPDARVRATMTQSFRKGTPMGEIMGFVGQFKSFPMALVNMVGGRDAALFRAGPNQDIGRGIRGMAATYTALLLFGYISMTLKDILKGRGPRDPKKKETILAALMQGGGLGIYGDVLFREQRDSSTVIAGLAGPSITTAADVILALNYGIRGEGGNAGKAAYRAVSQNIPFANLFYIKAAFDYLIGYQMMETMSPGALKRVEQRMKREYNQEFLFTKPSTQFKGF